MIYKNIESKKWHTNIQISFFEKEKSTSEYMVMMHVCGDGLTYTEQLHALFSTFDELKKTEFSEAKPVFMRFFLSDAANQADLITTELAEKQECAVSIIEQAPLDGSKIALLAYLQTNVEVSALSKGMYAVNDGNYTHYWTASSTKEASNSKDQMRALLDEYAMQLEEQGCTLEANAIRTWIFVQNVDVNYSGVVKARNEMFATQNLTTQTHFIASTGIQGRNANPKILVQLDTYAVKGLKDDQIQYLYASSHLNPTSEYGVSFERGTCVHYADRRHVFISGTASINNKGEVMYPGDIHQQTLRMWENIEALLKEAECDFSNVNHMIVYLRDIADYQTVSRMYAQRFPNKPVVFLLAPVCRPAWLIEMECMAIK